MFAVIAVILAPFVIAALWFGYQLRPGSDGPAVTLSVAKDIAAAKQQCGDKAVRADGNSNSAVADALAKSHVIGSALAFKLWASISGGGPFATGCYGVHESMGIRGALSTLKQGPPRQPDVKLFVPPGLTLNQIAERVGKLPGHSAKGFLDAASSGAIRSKYEPADVNSLEGLLFPDTYFIGADWTDKQVVQRLVDQFDTVADKVGLANAQGLTPYQVVVAASLIQTEAKVAEDAPLISAVIRNRINQGMPLQIDSTLCYIKGGCGGTGPTDADKAADSPYNTYKVTGLPPTPIASVTEANLTAALNPANVPYLYYVIADASGKHAFATTYEEHQRNVAAARAKGLL